jgi:hypothetical protein
MRVAGFGDGRFLGPAAVARAEGSSWSGLGMTGFWSAERSSPFPNVPREGHAPSGFVKLAHLPQNFFEEGMMSPERAAAGPIIHLMRDLVNRAVTGGRQRSLAAGPDEPAYRCGITRSRA